MVRVIVWLAKQVVEADLKKPGFDLLFVVRCVTDAVTFAALLALPVALVVCPPHGS